MTKFLRPMGLSLAAHPSAEMAGQAPRPISDPPVRACLAPCCAFCRSVRAARRQRLLFGLLQVVDPDAAISLLRNFAEAVPITHFYS